MTKAIWKVIEESKAGKPYVDNEEQYDNMVKIFSKLDEEERKKLSVEWDEIMKELVDDEFKKMSIENGEVIKSIEDLNIDFTSWVLVQGEELFKQFKNEGQQAIIDYMRKHHVLKNS